MRTMQLNDFALSALLALAPATGALAAGVPFTLNPSSISPSVTGAGSAFTADQIVMSDYVYVHQPAANNVSYPNLYVFDVTGFRNQGAAVATAGLGSSYGLYFVLTESDHLSNGQAVSDSGTIQLFADPTNNDGAPSVTLANGFAFANPAGTADDILLASGALLNGAFQIVNGIATKRFSDTLVPAAGEGGFFVSPEFGNHGLIDLSNTNTATSRQFLVQPDGSGFTLVNGAIGAASLSVPEPTSLAALAAGLLGLTGLGRRRRR